MPLTPRLGLLFALALSACGIPQTPSSRQWEDPQRLYGISPAFLAGTWYEVQRLPNWFEDGCTHVQVTYTPRADGGLDLVQNCRRNGAVSQITGVVTQAGVGRFKVKLDGVPFAGELWVLGTADGGRTVYLGTSAKDFGWVLHRDRVFGPEQRYAAQVRFGENGYDEAALQRTDQR
jgi:apolipoprotein D and lipocalin family protein